MGKVIVVASGKGGTGKSTVCAGVAAAFAKKNKRVLLIDCDSGMRGVDMMFGISDRLVYDISDIISGGCENRDAFYRASVEYELYCVAAPLYADDEVSPSLLKKFIESVKDDFDYVLIDSPAGTGSGFAAAACAADLALVVINADSISIRGCQNIRKKLETINVKDARLVINRFEKERFYKMGLYEDLDAVIDEAGLRLIGLIPEDVRVTALCQRGELLNNWSQSSLIFSAIVERIEGVDVPVIAKV
ncbi:MAG: AAA family ATPase [Ruminococcus sp.]|nr:AAA family ATPase [Ruminococcus sp.]